MQHERGDDFPAAGARPDRRCGSAVTCRTIAALPGPGERRLAPPAQAQIILTEYNSQLSDGRFSDYGVCGMRVTIREAGYVLDSPDHNI